VKFKKTVQVTLKGARSGDPDLAPFSEDFSSATDIPNLVSMCTRYEAMNSGANAENGVIRGGYGNSRPRAIRNSAYDFLSNFNRNYLVPLSRSSELFVESRRFYSTPPVFGAPGRSEPGRISRRSLGGEN